LPQNNSNNKSKKKPKGHKETLGDVGHVYYFDYGDGIKHNCLCSNSTLKGCSLVPVQSTLVQLGSNESEPVAAAMHGT
jgi:hypothetical protein